MPYAASCSRTSDLARAFDEVCGAVGSALNGATPDLAFVFATHSHAERFDQLASRVCERIGPKVLLGCAAEAVAGGGEEIEDGPAVSLWGAVLPSSEVVPFHLEFQQTPDGILCTGLPENLSDRQPDVRAVFSLGEPYSSVPNSIIERLADELPGVALIGGMASGGRRPGENRLFLNSDCVGHGAVGAVVLGGPPVRTVVSQGCRPIGTHAIVTKADRNIVYEIGGTPAMQYLRELFAKLPPRDQALARHGLHVGIAMNERQHTFRRGDFLIANVTGADPEIGAIAIGNLVRVGQTVQFHVRDAETADEDLKHLLSADAATHRAPPQAALLFSCNGRGTRLFSEPHHDAGTIQSHHGPLPLAGFFAQGEFGPVASRNHIHGYTASVALWE